ncbi:hypothetical protein FM106_14965 [Brachybacterium faecium]|nr:hypothetical protein BFR43_08375 [Brochothrix thermosphacta]SLM97833.1 hypothetical protein FM106_14965 [Brachybacterium faecium]
MARSKKNNFPTLLGTDHSNSTVKVWCPFCEEYHVHAKKEGHFSSHCFIESSPFKNTGYFIKL